MRLICGCLLLLTGLAASAQEAVVNLSSTVTGNQEQPRVMYIVPWQPPEASVYEYAPAAALAQELFREIDRDEFVRELEYRDKLSMTVVGADGGE